MTVLPLLLALTGGSAMAQSKTTAYVNGTVLGQGKATVVVKDGVIEQVGGEAPKGAKVVDVAGQCIGPGFIDSHVHLALLPMAKDLSEGGVAVAIDLASTMDFLANPPTELEVWSSGPMMTAFGGYPLNKSWGKAGYGRPVLGPGDAKVGVNQLIDAGAKMIKVPFANGPRLTEREMGSVVDTAHARGVKVVAHALNEESAAKAADNGCDVLAHVPREPMTDATVAKWRNKAVITTLKAFGGSPEAVDNLKRLREAGATILYGTDFGNSRTAGIDSDEIELMKQAGMTTEEALAAATTVPAEFWGIEGYGKVAEGYKAPLWMGPCDCAWCK